jgi:hypothetical protein
MAIGKLEKVELRSIWKNEATDFTCWLENNIEDLSDFLGFSLEVIEREKKVGSFSIDLYAQTADGEKVIIENQLEKTDHGHLGQVITYFTNLEAKCVVWIAKEARQEHANAINWLNESTDINFFLIQIEAYKIGDSKPAPYFKMVCEPNADMKAIGAEKKDFTEREKFNVAFWDSMMKKCTGKLNHFCNKKASKYHFHGGSAGKSGFQFVFLATAKYYGMELYIDSGDKDKNFELFHAIKEHKIDIEKDFGHELVWDEIPDKRACRVRFNMKEESIVDTNWQEVQGEMIETMLRFESILRPLIKGSHQKKAA